MKKVLAICYYGRSGSVFFQSLFDGHPQCITIPGTYISGYGQWFGEVQVKAGDIAEKFCHDYQCLFDPLYVSPFDLPCCGASPGIGLNFHKMGKDSDKSIFIDEEKFRIYLFESIHHDQLISAEDFFILIHKAYALSVGLDWNKIQYIIFALHSPHPNRSNFLKNLDMKMIYVIREPIQSALSLYKHNLLENKDIGLLGVINTIRGYSPLDGFEEKCQAIKLEDIHTSPESTLNAVCNWLKLEWNPVLLESTFNGELWHNLANATEVQGFNTTIISKKHEDVLTRIDRLRLEYYFRFLYQEWNYKNGITRIASRNLIIFFMFFKRYSLEKQLSLFSVIKNRLYIARTIIGMNVFFRRLFGKRPLKTIPLLPI